MKKLFIVFLLCFTYSQIFGVPPTYQLSLRNFSNPTTTTVEFDMYILWTNPGSDPFEYGSCQYCVLSNDACRNGATWTFTKIGSDMPSNLQPGLSYNAASGEIRYTGNLPSPGFIVSSTFPGTKVVRTRLTSSIPLQQCFWNLRWKYTGSGLVVKVSYLDPNGTGVFITDGNPANNLILDTNCIFCGGGHFPPTPNFYADSTTITAGRSVDFFDSTLNIPTTWSWSFPGGIPSSSNLQTPPPIVYNAIGTYSVSLTASNPFGTNSITKTNYITVLPQPCIPNWQQNMIISDASNVKDTLVFGIGPGATIAIDTCYGERIIPPPPPTGNFDVRFTLPTFDESKKDFRSDSLEITIWQLKFQPSGGGYPMTFKWDPTLLPNTGFFFLKDNLGGIIVNVNMKNQNSYTLTNQGITSLRIEYLHSVQMPVAVKIGWNMLSVPLRTLDSTVNSLFPGYISPAYGYNNGYTQATAFSTGKGYWTKFSKDTTYMIFGISVNPQNINVTTGWNMIGPFDHNIPVSTIIQSPPNIIVSSFFGWNPGYFSADTLKPGKGYWVKCSGNGILTRGSFDNIVKSISSGPSDNWTRFEFSNSNSDIVKLFLAEENELTENYDLPPVPPSGIFDVRFNSDKYAESFGNDHTIKINSNTGTTKIKAVNLNGRKFLLKDAVTGNLFNRSLEENAELEITSGLDNLILVEEDLIPKTYELSQNFPNPFNPSTTIKYQIPNDGFVKIIVYNVLGKEVKTLVNEYKKTGVYEIKFSGDNLASGIYFYKFQTGSFSDLKRMILIK